MKIYTKEIKEFILFLLYIILFTTVVPLLIFISAGVTLEDYLNHLFLGAPNWFWIIIFYSMIYLPLIYFILKSVRGVKA